MISSSDKIDKVFGAFAKAQAAFPPIPKNKTVDVYKKDGSYAYSYNYAELSEIIEKVRPVLAANGLSFTQTLRMVDSLGKGYVTRVMHASGQWFESGFIPAIIFDNSGMKDVAGNVTYGKRISLTETLGVASDDDVDAPAENNESLKVSNLAKSASQPPAPQPPASRREGATVSKPSAAAPEQDPGDYVVKIGRKLKDLKLKDILDHEITGYIEYLESEASKKGQPLSKLAQDFKLAAGRYFHAKALAKAGLSQPKVSNVTDIATARDGKVSGKLNRTELAKTQIKFAHSILKGKNYGDVPDKELVDLVKALDLNFAAKGVTKLPEEFLEFRKNVSDFAMVIIPKPKPEDVIAEQQKLANPNPLVDAKANSENASSDPGEYRPTFGRFKGHPLNSFQLEEIAEYVGHIEKTARNQNKEIKGEVGEFMTAAFLWIGMNTPPDEAYDATEADLSADWDAGLGLRGRGIEPDLANELDGPQP